MELAGVVLCGGAGRRIGGDKAKIRLGGQTLVERVADRIGAVASPVVLAAGDADVPRLPYARVRDARPHAGPLGGIVGAFAATTAPLLAVVAADMPFVSPDLLATLADLMDDFDAVVPVTERGTQPLHAVYARSAAGELSAALSAGDLRLRSALRRLKVRRAADDVWRAVDASGRFAWNVNTREDLVKLRREGAT